MENRIKIGDVWYVREDLLEAKEELELIFSREITAETNDVLVEASVLEYETKLTPGVMIVEERIFSMPSVDITFKNTTRDKECWDNDAFLSGVAHRNDKWMREMGDIDDNRKEVIIAVIDKMAELGWI